MAKLDGLFNVTATYEDDADITIPYGYYYRRPAPLKNYMPSNMNRSVSAKRRLTCISLCKYVCVLQLESISVSTHMRKDSCSII